ncbi:guanine nucleotide binding protein, alpha subunit [Rhizoclosmatium globosum]|uniref:Guanine nucleotide binding protein, alpha subunit n=1 Tax=Rhizoclosmatium globosum TaxID=329046 RepID=A0A1Y2CRW5_9FUNG|nr:guanine nucleotide binding protein, alpha subunit [Rhizoclosmatium globosum]|eukprot:ORY49752.1 guanine nucleotide binding protein, alpha subunit [Rhizoclosmatium globosum]
MCSGGSKEAVVATAAAVANSKEIDKQLKKEEEANLDTAKLLLLGTGETGKSTILKQMRLIHGVVFTEDEYIGFRSAIFMNIITCAKSLIHAMETLQIPYGFVPPFVPPVVDPNAGEGEGGGINDAPQPTTEASADPAAQTTSAANPSDPNDPDDPPEPMLKRNDPAAIAAREAYALIDPEKGQTGPVVDAAALIKGVNIRFGFVKGETLPANIIDAAKLIWGDSGVQYCYTRANEYQLIDCCAYFMNDIDRVCHPEYMPGEQDILNARMMTTSITETKFEVQGVTFRVFDVGGQRSQRKKWAPYFDDVRAIIYLVAMNSYDQVCFEDASANRMTESLNVFKSMCNHPMFKSTAIILFMNKIDLFRTKLETAMITNYFPEFQGPNTYERGSEFFARQFLQLNKNPEKKIYVHFTWATDTKQIKKILTMVNEIILSSNMASIGLM